MILSPTCGAKHADKIHESWVPTKLHPAGNVLGCRALRQTDAFFGNLKRYSASGAEPGTRTSKVGTYLLCFSCLLGGFVTYLAVVT